MDDEAYLEWLAFCGGAQRITGKGKTCVYANKKGRGISDPAMLFDN
jgi:hypothetical protein